MFFTAFLFWEVVSNEVQKCTTSHRKWRATAREALERIGKLYLMRWARRIGCLWARRARANGLQRFSLCLQPLKQMVLSRLRGCLIRLINCRACQIQGLMSCCRCGESIDFWGAGGDAYVAYPLTQLPLLSEAEK